MAQVTKKKVVKPKDKRLPPPIKKPKLKRSQRTHPKYGTSKLEDKFAKEFLDKLGYKYERQFEAKDIKRFYDFAVWTKAGSLILIEIDGSYYHGQGLLHEEKNPMQKHNEFVDKIKNEWAHMHCIPLIRIWEKDINEKPSEVIKMLKDRIGEETEKQNRKNEKNKRH